MKIVIPPPRTQPPPTQSFMQDFKLLLGNQMRLGWNKIKHWPAAAWFGLLGLAIGFLGIFAYLGYVAYGVLKALPLEIGQGFLSLIFMAGIAAQVFFGITAAFVILYMSEDLELFFMSPVPLRVVFAVKSLSIANSNLIPVILFSFLPGIFYGLLFQAGAAYYVFVLLVGSGFWLIGTALAVLINLVVMRIVPPHRSREAVGVIGGLGGILIALLFQIPSMIMASEQQLDISNWLLSQKQLLNVMKYFPWGWGSQALAAGIAKNFFSALGWSLLLLLAGIALFLVAFSLLEKGFRQGWISLNQVTAKKRSKSKDTATTVAFKPKDLQFTAPAGHTKKAPAAAGMWAVAKKDLLYMRRDTREWLGYLTPILLMMFFVGQYLFFKQDQMKASMITVLVMYTVMFSGNMALQSFGREGEADWFLNSVPLAGWPVVWGKLLGAVVPTIILMQALLVGTAVAMKVSASLTLMLAVGAVLLAFGASAIGLFYSINNARYNPESPQQRISAGASLMMYLINLVFMMILALGVVYLIPPEELVIMLKSMPPVPTGEVPLTGLIRFFYIISRPLLWVPVWRIVLGVIVTFGSWALVFFGFMAATVRQSLKGLKIESITSTKKKSRKKLL